MMKKEGILNILEKSVGYETALLTTFNYEIVFFEKAVLSRLIRNDRRFRRTCESDPRGSDLHARTELRCESCKD